MPNSNEKLILNLPEDTTFIIDTILKKQGLKESEEEILDKLEKNEKIRTEIIAELLVKKFEENISNLELSGLIKKELDIPSQKAQKIAKDLDKNFADIIKNNKKIERKTSIGKIFFPDKDGS